MLDQNAFGLFVSYYDLENDEYALEPSEFAGRLGEFRRLLEECVKNFPLGADLHVVDLGHAMYVELADGDQDEDPVVWLKMVRARLTGREFRTVGVLSYGSRWVDDDGGTVGLESFERGGIVRVAHSSEPLRQALWAEAASRQDDDDCPEGWGPGLYLATDAVEALGRALKNAPTPLIASGATFYRAGR